MEICSRQNVRKGEEKEKEKEGTVEINPLNTNLNLNLNSHLLPLFISYRSSGEKLIKYQENLSCMIMTVILMTNLFYKALILLREI